MVHRKGGFSAAVAITAKRLLRFHRLSCARNWPRPFDESIDKTGRLQKLTTKQSRNFGRNFRTCLPAEISARLKQRGVLINGVGPCHMRAVTHYDVDRKGCETALEAMAEAVRTN